jgi:hypothetical protein
MQYKKINNLLGWLCFVIASITYIMTMERSVSFWDCGEFISCAYRLQVAHQPGYPVFAMLGKAFSLLSMGDNTKVPYFTNMGSALASGATIMLLFWTITALAKKMLGNKNEEEVQSNLYLIMGAGIVGALAFTYTDTFWFSAVETIVFAWSALCTALVFWAILKWEAHADEPGADKWIVFIAYVIGLSIGIHLLNLLTIPAIALVYYLRRSKNITTRGTVIAILAGVFILVFIQYIIRAYTIKFSAYFDLFFVNTLHFGFGSGSIFFFLILIAFIVGGIFYSIRYKKPMLNLAFLCVAVIYFGYSSFAYIPIRAIAGTNLDNSHPDNAFTLNSYLNREQYGETPLLYGPYYDAKAIGQTAGANIYRKGKTEYEVSGQKQNVEYDHNTILPRIYSSEGSDPQFYKQWLQIPDGTAPNFVDNLKWMFSWQMYQMYWRYFLWNFAGRYNDMEGMSDMWGVDGNWTTGFFDGGKHLPKSIIGGDPTHPLEGVTYTPLFALPLILGLIGLIYHFNRNRRDALVITLLWFFTGLAIVLYVNQPDVQPRERDYSFYAFSIWIGLGVVGIVWLLQEAAIKLKNTVSPGIATIVAVVIGLLFGPVVLAKEEWKDHDRSTKMTPHDMAYNYLISCPKDAILFTYGDNDTYSLWYDQEVENIRPDVRIVNLSLFTGDWYIKQMTHKMNESAPLPITMPFEKYEDGVRDVLYYNNGIYDANTGKSTPLQGYSELKDIFDFISSDDKSTMVQYNGGDYSNYLPTKNFKMTIDKDEVIKSGVVPDSDRSRLADSMTWKYNSNYVMKDNLAMFDILVHNHWKRPICFTVTVGPDNLIGLEPYLYKEGFTYHLMPYKIDTSIRDQSEKINTMVMYNNLMTKFKWGEFKTAKYLDHESTTMFYPVMMTTFLDLTQGLIDAKKPDLALKVLHKYDEEMPDINPFIDVVARKFYLAQACYTLHDVVLGKKFVTNIDNYITDQLDYDYYLMQNNGDGLSARDVSISIQLIAGMEDFAKGAHQTDLYNKLFAQAKDYQGKFASLIGAQR